MTDVDALVDFENLLEADFDQIIQELRDSTGRIVLNADDLFRLSPAYLEDPDARMRLGPILYPTARNFTDKAFRKLLSLPPSANDLVVFTAGGGASGKSSALRAQANRERVDFIVDTTFSTPGRALSQVDQVLKANRSVTINYVYRPFEESVIGMLERALDASSRRVVPIDDMARTHVGAQLSIVLAMQKYEQRRGDRRVAIHLWENSGRNKVTRLSRSTCRRGSIRRLTYFKTLAKLSWMIFSKVAAVNGRAKPSRKPSIKLRVPKLKAATGIRKLRKTKSSISLRIKLPDGKIVRIRTRPPELSADFAKVTRAHAKSLQTGFISAIQKARAEDVPLSKFLPVS